MVFVASTFVWTGAASPQTYHGALRGQVSDSYGRIPDAEITLINEETGGVRSIVSDDAGEYAFASIVPGVYTVRVSRSGFQPQEQLGLRVTTQSALVYDVILNPAGITHEIIVRNESTLERATPAISSSLTAAQIASLPVFGRNTFYSAISTPNVIQSGDPQFVRYQDQTNASMLSLGGGPRRGNAYVLEGVSITDFLNRPTWFPSTEAIEDMRVQIRTYDAEVGRTAGGIFNVTARSGGNQWHGSALFVSKPNWTTGQLYFAKAAGIAKPPQRYYNWAGSFGGPIVRGRTFFWFSTDNYNQRSTRNNVLILPTALERAGDFSQSLNAQGQLIVIYDPLTTRPDSDRPGEYIRDPFPGNVIPAARINPVARAMLQYVPLPVNGRALNAQATLDDGPQDQETLKIDHRWSGTWSTSGLYGHQRTREPGSAFWGPFGTMPGDPGNSLLRRNVHFTAVNNLFVPNTATVVAVRYGHNSFRDDANNFPEFDAGTLGFRSDYVAALRFNTFPYVTLNGFNPLGNPGRDITTHVSRTANVNISSVLGNHLLKMGGDYRRPSADTISYGAGAGSFTFTEGFTQGPTPNSAGPARGDSVASFLLGYPSTGVVHAATPGNYFIDYYAAYFQDDFRVSPRLTLNVGVKYEYETGVGERNNRFTVGFDREATFPVELPALNLTGGLMYAGVDGYPTQQGQPLNAAAPRGGFAWSVSDRSVIRGGYGWSWVPTQIPGVGEAAIGARGYSAVTTLLASADGGLTPGASLSDPFPGGIATPHGNALGLATGAGGSIDFVDQHSRRGYSQQYSLDLQHQIGASSISVSYIGSRSERLTVGGTNDAVVNINQLDRRYLALGTALQQQVPNPFFGIAALGDLARSPLIPGGQLLRPFPQFDNVLAHRVHQARSRYNGLVMRWSKRMSEGYAADVNYALSRLDDNQYGETNSFSNSTRSTLNSHDLEADYGVSLLDVTHRLNFTVTVELPFGGPEWWLGAGRLERALLGGWSITIAGRYQSGFPLSLWQSSNNSGLFGSTQRPNLVPGVDPMTQGSQEQRAVNGWIEPAAFTAAPAFTFGNTPRTNPEWRGPGQRTTDLAIQKSVRLSDKILSVRADVLNLFDDPLFMGPVTAFGAPNFGHITAVGGFARSMQFHMRLTF